MTLVSVVFLLFARLPATFKIRSRSPGVRLPAARRWQPPSAIAVAGLISMSGAVICGTADGQQPAAGEPVELTLEALYHPEQKKSFATALPETRWIGESEPTLLVRRPQHWNQIDLETGKQTLWPVFAQLLKQLTKLEGTDSKQARQAALQAVENLDRADAQVLVRINDSLAIVSANEPARWVARDTKDWTNVTLDPSGRWIGYNRDGDLFLIRSESGQTARLSNDASDTLLDGILDWTYQEEIYGRGNYRGFWFSPDGNWLAMLRIDISGIEPYTLADASSDRGAGIVRRYPKAGDPIPHAALLLWDLGKIADGSTSPRMLARSTPGQQRIISGVWWHPHRKLLLYCVSDRRQTWRELRAIPADQLRGQPEPNPTAVGAIRDAEGDLWLREESAAWVEPPETPGWLADGGIVWKSPLPSGRHRLHRISADGKVLTPLTPDDFDVHEFSVPADGVPVIVTGGVVTRAAAEAESGSHASDDSYPGQRHAYRLEPGESEGSLPRLIPITTAAGWHETETSVDGAWVSDRYSTAITPPQLWLRPTGSSRAVREPILVEASTLKLESPLFKPQIFRIPAADGLGLPAMLVRPPSAANEEPCGVVVEVYGGPQAPVVADRWSDTRTLYRQWLARHGIGTLVVDNQSSAGRGMVDTWKVKGRLGELEFKDLMSAVEWLKTQPWVDAERLAIRGWSYGGFMTLYAMTHSDAFVAGIAGGSVTDWREYDAFYTERYMGLPSENPEGYRRTALTERAGELSGRVLLIHGESDDNVHPSGTLRMAAALQRAGIDFELMLYPGAAHAIRDPHQLWHLHQLTDRFLRRQLSDD